MKVRRNLSYKSEYKIVLRNGRAYVINKKNPKLKQLEDEE